MSATDFWANETSTWLAASLSGPQSAGVGFTLAGPTTATRLGFYRVATGSGYGATTLSLWRLSDGAQLAHVASPTDDGTPGWQWSVLPVTIGLVAGETYIITAYYAGDHPAYLLQSSVHTPPTPYNLISNYGRYTTTGDTFPDSTSGVYVWGANITTDPDVTADQPTGPATPPDVENSLASWLSSDSSTNTHHSDLPWRTDANVSSAKSTVEAINTSVGAGLGANVSTALSLLGSIVTIVTAIRDLNPVSALSTLLGNLQGASDAAATALQNLSNHAVDVLNGHAVTGSSTPHFAWVTAGDPVSFTTSTFLAVAADAYLVEITTPANGQALNVWNGVDVYFRAGWWCECIDGVGSERRYVDFRETWLRDGVRRLGGCLIVLQPGTQATITPYTLGPA